MKKIFNHKIIRPILAAALCLLGVTQSAHAVIHEAELWKKDNTVVCLLSDVHYEPLSPALSKEPTDSHLRNLLQLIDTMCGRLGEKEISLVVEDMHTPYDNKKYQSPYPPHCNLKLNKISSILTRIIPACSSRYPNMRTESSERRKIIDLVIHTLNSYLHIRREYKEFLNWNREKFAACDPTKPLPNELQTLMHYFAKQEQDCAQRSVTGYELMRVLEKARTECTAPTGNVLLDQYLKEQGAIVEQSCLAPLRKITAEKKEPVCSLVGNKIFSLARLVLFNDKLRELLLSVPFVEMNNLREIEAARCDNKKLIFVLAGGTHIKNSAAELKSMGWQQIWTKTEEAFRTCLHKSKCFDEACKATYARYSLTSLLDLQTEEPSLYQADHSQMLPTEEETTQMLTYAKQFMQSPAFFAELGQKLQELWPEHDENPLAKIHSDDEENKKYGLDGLLA